MLAGRRVCEQQVRCVSQALLVFFNEQNVKEGDVLTPLSHIKQKTSLFKCPPFFTKLRSA